MGIYDREYIRGESSGTGLFSGVSPVTKSIIAINVIVFLLWNLLHLDSNGIGVAVVRGHARFYLPSLPPLPAADGRIPRTAISGRWCSTCGFSGSSAAIWRPLYGSVDFVVFYLASAILTTLAGLIVAASVPLNFPIFGCWGAILSTMTLFTLFYPKREILFAFFIPMPMWVLLTIYILIPLLSKFNGSGNPGIDLGIVLAGAGFAYAYKQLDLRWSRLTSGRMFRPRLRIFSSVGYDQGPGRSRAPAPRGPRPASAAAGRPRSRCCPRSSSTRGWMRSSPRSPATAIGTA